MATIPMGNYGQAVARPGPVQGVQRLDALNAAADRTGQIAGGVVTDMAQAEVREQQARQGAQAQLTLATFNNDLHDAKDRISTGVLEGSVDPKRAAQEFDRAARELGAKHLGGYMPAQRETMEAHAAGVVGTLQRTIAGVVQKRQQSDTAATIDQFGEQAAREGMRTGPGWAADKYAALLDFSGPAAGWTPEQIAVKKQAFREGTAYAFFDAAGTGALTSGDVKGLDSVLARIQGPAGEVLDPLKRVQLTHQMFGWKQSLLAAEQRRLDAVEREQFIREKDAVTEINKAIDLTSAGQFLSPEYIRQLSAATTGTQQQGATMTLLASQQKVAGFAARGAGQREAILNAMREDGATRGTGTDPVAFKQLNSLEQMNATIKRNAEDNPWEAAQKYGVIQSAPLSSLVNPQVATQAMQQRMAQISLVEDWVGHKISPLQPQEADQLAQMLRAMPVSQAASMLSQFGSTMNDSVRTGHVAKQLGDKDGDMSLAMLFASQNTTQGRTVAELVLRGNRALKDNLVMVDKAKDSGWEASIAKQINGAYLNPQVEDQAKRAAMLILIARSSDSTQDSTTVENAVTLATGGIVERNGAKLPLPYGMKADEFDKRVRAINYASLVSQVGDGFVLAGGTSVPLPDFVAGIPDAQLVSHRNGSYYVRAGAGFVTNSKGKLIELRIAP